MAMGESLGHVTNNHVALVVFVGVITMSVSTYMILGAERLYANLKDFLKVFERKKTYESAFLQERVISDHVVLVGADRTGGGLLPFFKKQKLPYLVIDFNPSVFTRLSAEKTPVLFGDIGDEEIIELAQINKARLVVSTISNLADNLNLLEFIKRLKKRPISIFTAHTKDEAVKYYEKGATYVIVPQAITGVHLRHVFKTYGTSKDRIAKLGKSQFNRLISM